MSKLDEKIVDQSANSILNADFIIFVAGAGFSADSGLPVYNDVGNNPIYAEANLSYADLADPYMLMTNPSLFWGFWADCVNKYRSHSPHKGYHIINDWCTKRLPRLQAQGKELSSSSNNNSIMKHPWYVYTSNVDGFFRRKELTAFDKDCICEMHGCCEEVVCSSYSGHIVNYDQEKPDQRSAPIWETVNNACSDLQRNECSKLYDTHPLNRIYEINQSNLELSTTFNISDLSSGTMLQEEKVIYPSSVNWGLTNNNEVPMCTGCNLPVRPKVILFNDTDVNTMTRVHEDTEHYQRWEEQMESILQQSITNFNESDDMNDIKRIVIIEIGCGMRIPSLRQETESVITDTLDRCNTELKKKKNHQGKSSSLTAETLQMATLIRINPDFPEILEPWSKDVGISIKCNALEALLQIDQRIQEQNNNKQLNK